MVAVAVAVAAADADAFAIAVAVAVGVTEANQKLRKNDGLRSLWSLHAPCSTPQLTCALPASFHVARWLLSARSHRKGRSLSKSTKVWLGPALT